MSDKKDVPKYVPRFKRLPRGEVQAEEPSLPRDYHPRRGTSLTNLNTTHIYDPIHVLDCKAKLGFKNTSLLTSCINRAKKRTTKLLNDSYRDLLDNNPITRERRDVFPNELIADIKAHPAYMHQAENNILNIYNNYDVSHFDLAVFFFKHMSDLAELYADYQTGSAKPFNNVYGLIFFNNTTLIVFVMNFKIYERMYIIYNSNDRNLEMIYLRRLRNSIPRIFCHEITELIWRNNQYANSYRNRSYCYTDNQDTHLLTTPMFGIILRQEELSREYESVEELRKKTMDQLVLQHNTVIYHKNFFGDEKTIMSPERNTYALSQFEHTLITNIVKIINQKNKEVNPRW